MMERVKATRELIITKASSKPISLMRMRLALKEMTAASRSFPNLTTLVRSLSLLLLHPQKADIPSLQSLKVLWYTTNMAQYTFTTGCSLVSS